MPGSPLQSCAQWRACAKWHAAVPKAQSKAAEAQWFGWSQFLWAAWTLVCKPWKVSKHEARAHRAILGLYALTHQSSKVGASARHPWGWRHG
jgi:hypothetical protein